MMDKTNNSLYQSAFSQVTGKIQLKKLMKTVTWLGVGGEAEIFFQPSNREDLSRFLFRLPKQVGILPIGVCSNLLVRDGGIPDVTIRLGRGFSEVNIDGLYITVGGASLDSRVAMVAAEVGVDLAFLRTIPGTIGGAVKMNAGCYGTCLADVFERCEIITRDGKTKVLTSSDINFSYRSSDLRDDCIVTRVTLKGKRAKPALIRKIMEKNQLKRKESQPIGEKTGGSTFKNPKTKHHMSGVLMSAWQLVDQANLRGKKLRGAQVSELHSNFLINLGNASAEDFEALGELIQERVYFDSGIKLEWEIKRVGLRAGVEERSNNLENGNGW